MSDRLIYHDLSLLVEFDYTITIFCIHNDRTKDHIYGI